MILLINFLMSLPLAQTTDSPNNSWPWVLLILLVVLVAIFWWASTRSNLDSDPEEE